MANAIHYDEIRQLLINQRRNLLNEIQSNLRDARVGTSEPAHYRGESGEITEVHPEDDLAIALIQLKGQMLNRIEQAVRCLDEGAYGCCRECGVAISAQRLRALPFAVRCKDCEEILEESERRDRAHPSDAWRHC